MLSLSRLEAVHDNSNQQQLIEVMGSGNKDIILKAVDELEETTRPFAERVMDISIKEAMTGKKIE